MRIRSLILLILALFFSLSLLFQLNLEKVRGEAISRPPFLYLPTGRYLRAATLGYENFAADILYLWSIQRYSRYEGEHRFRYLEHVYNMITDLDPQYIDPYLIGALTMAREGSDYERAFKLLEKGMRNNPDEWILPLDAGFYSLMDLKDYPKAIDYFMKASKIEGCPPEVDRLIAGAFLRKGDKVSSLKFWLDIYNSTTDERIKEVSYNHIYDLKIAIDLEMLQSAIDNYKEKKGRVPSSLSALVREGFLKGIPVDPDGKNYEYDRNSGKVSAASEYRLRH